MKPENWETMTDKERLEDVRELLSYGRAGFVLMRALRAGVAATASRPERNFLRLTDLMREGIKAMRAEEYPAESDIEDAEEILEVATDVRINVRLPN